MLYIDISKAYLHAPGEAVKADEGFYYVDEILQVGEIIWVGGIEDLEGIYTY